MKSKSISPKTNSTITGPGAKRQPAAPAVYRPQPLQKVLQTKIGRHQAAATAPQTQPQTVRPLRPQANVPINRAEQIRNSPRALRPAVAQRKAAPTPHNVPRRPFVSRVAQLTQHARVTRSQTLVKDCGGGKLAGTSFSWSSNFDVDIVGHKVVVTINIRAAISPEQFDRVWRRGVAEKWNNKFMISANGENYPIEVNLVRVDTGEHYAVTVKSEGRVSGSGSRGHFGTESMTVWGEHDVFNVAHEVGHMLGNVDEYGVVKLSPTVERDYLTTPSTGIMGKSEFDPLAHNYYLIQHFAKAEMIAKNIIKPTDTVEIKPDLASRHGDVGDLGGPSLSAVVAARGMLKPKPPSVTTTTTTTPTPSAEESELLARLAQRRASMATATATPPSTVGPGGATSSTAPRPLPPRPMPTTPAHKPSAVATATTTATATVAHKASASSSSTPPGSAAAPAKTASAPVKRAARTVVIHPPLPPIPKIQFHYARVQFLDAYIIEYISSLTDEQMAWF